MSMRAINWATNDTLSTGGARLCLFHLANCSRLVNGEELAWPGHEELARRCNVKTTRSVERYVERLEQLGLIGSLQSRTDKLRLYLLKVPADPTALSGQEESQPDSSVALTRQSRRADPTAVTPDPTVSSSPIIGEPMNPLEPIESSGSIAGKGGEGRGPDLPEEPPTLLSLEGAWELAEKNDIPASREKIAEAWRGLHAQRNKAGYWRDRFGRALYDFRWALEERARELSGPNGHGKNGAPMSQGMRAMEVKRLEVVWNEHVANPQLGRQATTEQIRDFRILTQKLRTLRAGA